MPGRLQLNNLLIENLSGEIRKKAVPKILVEPFLRPKVTVMTANLFPAFIPKAEVMISSHQMVQTAIHIT